MKLLALDTSSTQTGWAYYEDGQYIKSGVINLKKIKDVDLRVKSMINEINILLKKIVPNHVIIEDVVVERNWHTFKILTIIVGSLYGLCINNDYKYSCYSPAQWRNIIDPGKKPKKGEELKNWDIEKAKMITKKKINDDEADAILLGAAYLKTNNLK